MPDLLLNIWLAAKSIFAYPPVSAASAAMLMASFKLLGTEPPPSFRKWVEVPMVGVSSYTLVPLSIWFGMDPSGAAGLGAFVGYIGMWKLQDRLDHFLGFKKRK